MGIFKGLKDLGSMAKAAPDMLSQTSQLAANAKVMQVQQQQAAVAMANFAAPASSAAMPAEITAPISGVDLVTYAQISAGLAAYNYDQAQGPILAAQRGIDAASWAAAVAGWNERIAANPAVAKQFNALYTGRS